MPPFQPSYIEAFKTGRLQKLVNAANSRLQDCDLCPRKCHVNRLEGETGICKTGRKAIVASYSPHFGEESSLVGNFGSGTIFFTHCSLGCSFCQNSDISHEGYGVEVSSSHLARIMINLQHLGCHNINFVTPSHIIPQILSAILIAVKNGLNIPLIYNSSGYDDVSSLKLLDGIIDIYMPDFKFWDSDVASQTCNAANYPEIVKKAVMEMHSQVGDLQIVNEIAVKGLLIRHLVLPYKLSGTYDIVNFIRKNISADTYLNIMAQYHPCGQTNKEGQLGRGITDAEYFQAIGYAIDAGLNRLDKKTR